jgi:peptide/nickel transport system permease protein
VDLRHVVCMRLSRYILRRLLLAIPVLIGVSLIIFTLTRVTGDPGAAYITERMDQHQIDAVYEKYHLNDDMGTQYVYWLQGLLQGDWGWSKTAVEPVSSAIMDKFPATFELALVSMALSVLIGIGLGTWSAAKKNRPFDHSIRLISLLGVSIPIFWLGLILLLIFYNDLHWLPLRGRLDDAYYISGMAPNGPTGFMLFDTLWAGRPDMFLNAVWHLILPSVTLAFASVALILRVQRNSMLEVLGLDYIRTARAKGVSERTIIRKHARKNALIPTTTVVGLSFGALLGGAVLTESIFKWPGLGRWSAESILRMDSYSILGFCLFVALIYVLVNLAVDIIYAYLDPRVRLE